MDKATASAGQQAVDDPSLKRAASESAEQQAQQQTAAAKTADRSGAHVAAVSARKSRSWVPSIDQTLVVGIAVLALGAMVFVSRQEESPDTKLFTKELLSTFDGTNGKPTYLAILGQVFDVTKGQKYYGAKGGYAFFVAKDASRAFVSGDFKGDLTDDVEGLTNEQYASLQEWANFYKKEYIFKGRLIGAFYNRDGNVTMALRKVRAGARAAKTVEELRRESEAQFPKCNMRWSDLEGGWVSCDGEDLRPRKIFIQLPGGKPAERCACMQGIGWSDIRQVYPNCAPEAQVCQVSPPS